MPMATTAPVVKPFELEFSGVESELRDDEVGFSPSPEPVGADFMSLDW